MDEYTTDYLEAAAEEAERTDTPTNAVEKLITQVEEAVAQAEPKHSRRKQRRERAALIERLYMVQIRHYERAHPFRRVYKPP